MGLAIIAEKINFKAKNITKMKDFIIIKSSISYNTTILVDVCVCMCVCVCARAHYTNVEEQSKRALKCKMTDLALNCGLMVALHHPVLPLRRAGGTDVRSSCICSKHKTRGKEKSSESDCQGGFVSLSKFISLNTKYILPCNSK